MQIGKQLKLLPVPTHPKHTDVHMYSVLKWKKNFDENILHSFFEGLFLLRA